MNNKSVISIILFFLTLIPLTVSGQENSDIIVEPFEKDTESVVFVPKGQWVTGLSVSYSQSDQNKYQFLVIEDLSGDTYSFNIAPMVLYVFKDDMGAGGKFGYKRSLTKLESAEIVLDPENRFDVDHLYSLSHDFYTMGIFRNYFAIGKSRRFGFFSELQLMLGGGQSKLMTGTGESLSGSYSTNFNMNVGLAPGLVCFLNNYSALEVNIGVLGFNYSKTLTKRDQIYESNYDMKSANFKINLFSITFGVAWYI